MKLKVTIVTFLIFFFGNLSFAQQGIDYKNLDKYIEQQREMWNIPGLAISVVKNGKVVYEKSFGVRDVETEKAVDKNSLFAVASCTKSFTSAALAIMVDEGRISWDDKVIDYIPYFQLYDPYVTNAMTIRDLLCHRAGFETFSGDLLWYRSNYTREEIIRRTKHLKPTYGFRNHFGYSNIMFLIAGQVIEAVTDTTWDDYVEHHFLHPLKMKNTVTSISDFNEGDNIAMPHHVELDGTTQRIEYFSWDNVAPAGAINSSVADMSNWLIFHLNKGEFKNKHIISEEQIWEMQHPQTIEHLQSWSPQLWPTKHFEAYGLGWEIFDYHGRKIVNHGGGSDGMISKMVIVPEENLGFIILTNSINYLPTALMYQILDDYFDKEETDWGEKYHGFYESSRNRIANREAKEDKERVKNTTPLLPLESYCGTYGGDMYGNAEVKLEDGKLKIYFAPTPDFIGELEHWHYNTFSIRLKDLPMLPRGMVNFILSAEGKVEEMKIKIPNPDFYFEELEFKKSE